MKAEEGEEETTRRKMRRKFGIIKESLKVKSVIKRYEKIYQCELKDPRALSEKEKC